VAAREGPAVSRGDPKSELRKWARAIADAQDWQAVREGIEAKHCGGPAGVETVVLIRSVERREKERAMHERFARQIEDRLTRLGQRVQRARHPLDVRRFERQVGRLLERNQRAAGRYVIEFVPDPTLRAGVRLEWRAQPAWDDWARWSEGGYVLRTNVTDWSPDELWRTYIQLTDAEAAFRIQKSELGIRPVWHQRADRVQAHILICFLAYVLWKTLEQWQRRAGLGQSGDACTLAPGSLGERPHEDPPDAARPVRACGPALGGPDPLGRRHAVVRAR